MECSIVHFQVVVLLEFVVEYILSRPDVLPFLNVLYHFEFIFCRTISVYFQYI
jgi:hypothetical protein